MEYSPVQCLFLAAVAVTKLSSCLVVTLNRPERCRSLTSPVSLNFAKSRLAVDLCTPNLLAAAVNVAPFWICPINNALCKFVKRGICRLLIPSQEAGY